MRVDHKMGSTSYHHLVLTTDLGRDYFESIKNPLLYLLHLTPWLGHSLALPELILKSYKRWFSSFASLLHLLGGLLLRNSFVSLI